MRNRNQRSAFQLLIASIAVTSITLLGACASTQPAGEQVDDAMITTKVESKLAADPEVNPFNVDVDTDAGVVRLSGTVEDEATRQEAAELARNTDGVVSVVNDIRVGKKTAGERVADAAIVTKVKAKLAADPEINPFNIDVDANEGVVTLSGTVAKSEAKGEAEKLARSTSGVKNVENRINVKEKDSDSPRK